MSKTPDKLMNFNDFDEFTEAPEISVSQPKNVTKDGEGETSIVFQMTLMKIV